MKKLISLMAIMFIALTSFANVNAEEDVNDIFGTNVQDSSEILPAEETTETTVVIDATLDVTADNTAANGELKVMLASDKELDSAKLIIDLPESVTVDTSLITVGNIFDTINAEETTIDGTRLTISLFSAQSVLANGDAVIVPFTINAETEQRMYNFSLSDESTLNDSANNVLNTEIINAEIELMSVAPVEITEKEEGFAQTALLLLTLGMGLFVFGRRKRTV